MPDIPTWTTEDFDSLSWHDCHVHGFSLEAGADGTADVIFDIDFIVEWRCHADGPVAFRIAPANLTFHAVSGLRVELDYAAVTAGMTPFSLAGIERTLHENPHGFRTHHWRLPINWPTGAITFESPGFTQVLRRAPLLVERQYLEPAERKNGRSE